MLLRHWYLTARGMPLAPLIRLNWQYLAAVVATRGGWNRAGGVCVDVVAQSASGVVVAARWGAGIVGPFVLAILVFRILRHPEHAVSDGGVVCRGDSGVHGWMAASLLQQIIGTTCLIRGWGHPGQGMQRENPARLGLAVGRCLKK